jgi:squalene-hopene/tetraprenyl-beta-curcumene cyclase
MSPQLPLERVSAAYQTALFALLAERTPAGHWVGELSTSALSTATAVGALSLVQKAGHGAFDSLIAGGIVWLSANQNVDGGWGDTTKSLSNISTTMLCRAAFHLANATSRFAPALTKAEQHLSLRYGKNPAELAEAVRARYGKDRTFSVPILMTSALAGLVDWQEVPPLPFELACFPQSWFRLLRLPVVSYALPALIAIGQAVYHHRPPWNPVIRLIRRLSIRKSLRVLERIQPSSGGFLEATPLTSFVTMSLACIGQAGHPVAHKAVEFLVRSVRPDGSWPIDSNLATWITTLSVNALAAANELIRLDRLAELYSWLRTQQCRERHPYTGADPGGWGWTDLPGSVPDGDDTPGVLLALEHLDSFEPGLFVIMPIEESPIPLAVDWLFRLQNGDGGWPTFCRGWTNLAFDRSGADLTAHALRALKAWRQDLGTDWLESMRPALHEVTKRICDWQRSQLEPIDRATRRGLDYLSGHQRPDGSWLPLWFGCQHAPDDINPTYGTARVLAAYRDLQLMNSEQAKRGVAFLLGIQNSDGGWGGAANTPSSVEETALAVEILVDAGSEAEPALQKGLAWLVQRIEAGGLDDPAPIGFYFAKLWYFEHLYPIIFSVAALGRALRRASRRPAARPPS